ncbi:MULTISPECIES: DUF2252 domain-containing protein [Acidobacteriaceae]|uniref:DUF2252 domain-containing protein n=1 Tax=Acidobacteriaceae TaxID=204434 RepID=UPI00131BBB39|nr:MULTISPECIES: DUF2252 domain-containing protein [Acidobacteriaceae]MDW5265899.1 DUF2252 domain-containing protein [Edaphobacter sp.]
MTKTLEVKERFALGQERRKQMRRTVHAEWKASERKEHPLKLLAASMRGRVPALVTLKYQRMALSPFGYFRGAVPVMAYDLSLVGNTGILSQLCGDAHVRNLGAYAGPDGRLVFDINDFDESLVGPFEWDVKRMATSLILAGREAGVKGVHCRDAAAVFLERYRYCITAFVRMPLLEVARYQVHRLKNVSPVEGILRLAERATPMHTLSELTEVVKAAGQQKSRVFKTIAPVLTRVKGREAERVVASLELYAESLLRERRHLFSQYRPVDVAFKVVGTGSVGLRDYCVYMEGNGAKDPLFIQIKEEVASAYAPYIGKVNGGKGLSNHRGKYHQGRRAVEGQRAMQMQSDPFLGWTTIDGREYMVRQLNDHKASIQVVDLKAGLLEYANVCGELLARGHARSGDCLMLGGYLGKSSRFDEAVVKFAEAYANQTEKDWHELVQSMKKSGKKAASGKDAS